MDRRIWFFLGAALVCLLLVPVATDKFRAVCLITAAAYVVLAGATALDQWSRRRDDRTGTRSDAVARTVDIEH